MTRPVTLLKWVSKYNEGKAATKSKKEAGKGIFHQWGCGYEEFETGPGNYSTGIIELPDGSIINQPVELFKFDDKE